MCASSGLTAYGLSACTSQIRGDAPERTDLAQVLSIGLFDGLGALRIACDALSLPMAGHVSVERDPKAKRVVEAFFPDSVFHDDVTTVDEEMVKTWSLRFSNAGVVILGAGPPCQGVSKLNADRKGALRDERSKLFAEVPRIKALVQKAFFWAQVHLLMESVASMNDKDRHVMSDAVELQPYRIDSLGLTICRRPRLYWVTWELTSEEEVQVEPPDEQWEVGAVTFTSTPDQSKLLQPGWRLAGEALPTFTTARPSPTPGRKPAGLETLGPQERNLWIQDNHRFPPYQYAWHCGVVNKHGEWRTPDVAEREVCMGFPKNYTRMCHPKQHQQGIDFENARMTLIGNSWQAGVIVWLLGQLFHPLGLCTSFPAGRVVQTLTPGFGEKNCSLCCCDFRLDLRKHLLVLILKGC